MNLEYCGFFLLTDSNHPFTYLGYVVVVIDYLGGGAKIRVGGMQEVGTGTLCWRFL